MLEPTMNLDAPGPLRVVQVNTSDFAGGAARIALSLHQAYRRRGVEAWLAVGRQRTREPGVLGIDNEGRRNGWSRTLRRWAAELLAANQRGLKGAGRLSSALSNIAEPARQWRLSRGLEDFDYPGSRRLLDLVPAAPQVVHCHNLHGGYFDLRAIPTLSRRVPVFLTLHDAWLLSGHCVHGGKCERWRIGCGECPDLETYPPVRRDATRRNWHRKARIYARSRLHIATPCRWLMESVNASALRSGVVSQRVIPNGIDLSVFNPGSRQQAREQLGIPKDRPVLLFVACDARSNPHKDYECLRAAVSQVANTTRVGHLLLLALGGTGPNETIGSAEIRFVPFRLSHESVAQYYRAADLYAHAAKADTFPNTILEAMACGTAVVATAVCGIPEQVEHGVTGYLTPPADPAAMAARVVELLRDPARLRAFGSEAADAARRKFALERMANDYLDWYHEVLAGEAGPSPGSEPQHLA